MEEIPQNSKVSVKGIAYFWLPGVPNRGRREDEQGRRHDLASVPVVSSFDLPSNVEL